MILDDEQPFGDTGCFSKKLVRILFMMQHVREDDDVERTIVLRHSPAIVRIHLNQRPVALDWLKPHDIAVARAGVRIHDRPPKRTETASNIQYTITLL